MIKEFCHAGVNVCGVYCVSSSIRAGEAAAQLSKVLSQFATEKGELDRLHDLPQTGVCVSFCFNCSMRKQA